LPNKFAEKTGGRLSSHGGAGLVLFRGSGAMAGPPICLSGLRTGFPALRWSGLLCSPTQGAVLPREDSLTIGIFRCDAGGNSKWESTGRTFAVHLRVLGRYFLCGLIKGNRRGRLILATPWVDGGGSRPTVNLKKRLERNRGWEKELDLFSR